MYYKHIEVDRIKKVVRISNRKSFYKYNYLLKNDEFKRLAIFIGSVFKIFKT